MPFDLLETQTKATMPPMASLSYMRGRKASHDDSGDDEGTPKIRPKLIVTLPTTVCITQAERFAIFIGTGEDRGKIRICGLKKGVPGGVIGTTFKQHVMLRFGFVPKFGNESFATVKCPITRIDNDTYEIEVPPEILADSIPQIPLRKRA